jgi:hypothetical protein
MLQIGPALEAAVRAGSLGRYPIVLEAGEFENRRLWLRPEVSSLLVSGKLDPRQVEVVHAALRRFVIGGPYTVVTAACKHREVAMIGDIRELKGELPPFVELRFKPPKDDLRLFGRFVGKDDLVLTTFGLKTLAGKGQKQRDKAEGDLASSTIPGLDVDRLVAPAMRAANISAPLKLSGLVFDFDSKDFLGKRKPFRLIIDRRIGVASSENVFYSQAPFRTKDHLEVLTNFERAARVK